MKTIAQQIITLRENTAKTRNEFRASFAKEAIALCKRLGIDAPEDYVAYETCFNAYLGDEYPTDKDGNNAPLKKPSKINDYTLIYLLVMKLPYIAKKYDKWLKLYRSLRDAENTLQNK